MIMANYNDDDYKRAGENTSTLVSALNRHIESYEESDSAQDEFQDELRNKKVDEEIVKEILKAFYEQIGIGFIPSNLDKDLKAYVRKQYKDIHCFNLRTKHLDDSKSKISKILAKHEIVPHYGAFSIVGTYVQVQVSEKDGGYLKTVFSTNSTQPKLYSQQPKKVPAGWYDYV